MPYSIFGSPSRLLTPSGSTPVAGNSFGMTTPVHPPPPSFADIHFDTIGKQPNLLSRISAPDPGQLIFRSSSPVSPHPSPSPLASHAVPNARKLVERIQMDPSQYPSSVQPLEPYPAHPPLSAPRINRLRYPMNLPVASSSLIPPIEILSTASESNLTPSGTQPQRLQQFQTLANESLPANKVRDTSTPELAYPIPSPITPTVEQPNRDASSPHNTSRPLKKNSPPALLLQPTQSPFSLASTALHSPNPHSGISLSQSPDVATPVSHMQVAHDSLSAIHARLQAKSNALASLAPPTSLSKTPTPPPSNTFQLTAGITGESHAHTEEPSAIVLRRPYPHQNNSTSNGVLHQEFSLSGDSNALALTSLQTSNLPPSRSTHMSSLVDAMKKLQAAAGAAVKVQLDADTSFETERMEFDERRKVFEERMLAREAEYQAQVQAVQKQSQELRAREERILALEEESRLREETRRARDAQRRARDDQQNFEEELRRTTIQEEIADAIKLLEEVKVEKQHWQEERERSKRVKAPTAENNTFPLQFSAGIGSHVKKEACMTEEETKAVDNHNRSLLVIVKLTEKLQEQIVWTHQSSNTLQRMKETRLQTAEAECRRIANEEAQVEETAKQADEEQKRRCRDQAHNRQGRQSQQRLVSIGGDHFSQADPFAEQQVHAEAQLQKTQSFLDAQAEYADPQVFANNRQTIPENAARIPGHLVLSAIHGDGRRDHVYMGNEVDELEPSPVAHTLPLPDQKRAPHSEPAVKTSRFQGTSGKVMLGTPSTTSGAADALPVPSTPTTMSPRPVSYKTPLFVSASTEVGRQVVTDTPLYPTEFYELSISPPPNVPTSKGISFPTTPKAQTAQKGNSPNVSNISPVDCANLRHIKKNRSLVEGSTITVDSNVKLLPINTIKMEEMVNDSHDLQQTSNVGEDGMSARSMDATDPILNDDPPPAHAVSNPSDSQRHDMPQISTEFVTSQAPNAHALPDVRVNDSVGRSVPMPGIITLGNSPEPWSMDASVEHGEWAAAPISPRSEPSESAHGYDPNRSSRRDYQTSAHTPSPEGLTRKRLDHGVPHHPVHYSPPRGPPTSYRPERLEKNEAGALHRVLPFPSRPLMPMGGGRKRPAEDNEEDHRDRRRPRGDHYEPERDKDAQNSRGLIRRYSPPAPKGSSLSAQRQKVYVRPRSPGRKIVHDPRLNKSQREMLDRRGDTYRPDYSNAADSFRNPSSGYRMGEREDGELQDGGIALLGRMSSTPAARGNPSRGRGRGRGDNGRGRGARGRTPVPLPSRPLEDRIAK